MLDTRAIHFFSQLIYLDAVPAIQLTESTAAITVALLTRYYFNDPVGMLYLKNRFIDIPKEYEQWLSFLEQESLPYSEWKITDIFDDNKPGQTGLYGCTYLAPTGERVVAFRGSELLGNRYYENDYVTDLALSYMIRTPQQARVDDYWARFGKTEYKGLAVTGHSLGGNLAVYGALMAPAWIQDQITICIAFNAPGFSREFSLKTTDRLDKIRDRIILYQNRFDPVSSMLDNIVEPAIIASRFDASSLAEASVMDIFYPHSNFMFETDDSGEFVMDPSGKKCKFCEMVHIISDLFMLLPRKERIEICKTALAVLFAEPSPEKKARYSLDEILKHISHNPDIPALSEIESSTLSFAVKSLDGVGASALYNSLISAVETPHMPKYAQTLTLILRIFGMLRKSTKLTSN